MRILVLNYEYPPLGGGAGNAAYFLCREWGKSGHTVDVVTTWFHGLGEKTRESENVTVYRVRSLRKKAEQSNPLEMMSYVRKGYKKALLLCKENNYDTVISFFAIPSGLIAKHLFSRTKIPFIVLLRGGDVPGFLPGQLRFFHFMTMHWTRKIWKSARRVIANSKGLQLLAQQTATRIGITVDMVPNGVDTDFFQPAVSAPAAPFTFMFAGRFSKQKNIPVLLAQFEPLAANAQVKLILVGNGPEKPMLEKMIVSSKALSSAVTVFPWKSKEELRSLYQSSHCFVNPSSHEGLPNTLLEAMACGLPIIASNIGGNNELVENRKNGFLFDVSDPSGLGKHMQEIMGISDSKSMGSYSRNVVEKGYSWCSASAQIIPAVRG